MELRYSLSSCVNGKNKVLYKIKDNITGEELFKNYDGTELWAQFICNRMNVAFKSGEIAEMERKSKSFWWW